MKDKKIFYVYKEEYLIAICPSFRKAIRQMEELIHRNAPAINRGIDINFRIVYKLNNRIMREYQELNDYKLKELKQQLRR